MNGINELVYDSTTDDIIDIISRRWLEYQKASDYRHIVREYRKRYPYSYDHGIRDATIERIVRELAIKKRIQKGHVQGSPVFVPNWVRFWGVDEG